MTIIERIEEIERDLEDVEQHVVAERAAEAPDWEQLEALRARREALHAALNEIDQCYYLTLGGAA